MKMLQISEDYHPVTAGGAYVDTKVAEAASERGYDVTVVTARYEGAPRRETHNGVRIYRPAAPAFTDRPYGSVLNTLGRLKAAVVVGLVAAVFAFTNDIDVVYSTNHFVHPFAKTIAVVTGTPLVSFVGYTPTLHREGPWYADPMSLFEGINFRFFLGQHVHCRNPSVREEITRHNPRSTVRVAHGILDPEQFRSAWQELDGDPNHRNEVREKLCADPESVLLVYVGSLEEIKRPEAAVRALAALPKTYELAVIGDGERRDETGRVACEVGVADRVQFVGERPHVRTLQSMLVADGLVLPSKSESYSAVVLEALACSCDVFATPVGVVPELAGRVDRLTVCGADEMADRIAERGDLASAVALDETILEQYPIERYTDTVCDSFLAVSGGGPASSVEADIAG